MSTAAEVSDLLVAIGGTTWASNSSSALPGRPVSAVTADDGAPGREDPLGSGRDEPRAGGQPPRGRHRQPLTWRRASAWSGAALPGRAQSKGLEGPHRIADTPPEAQGRSDGSIWRRQTSGGALRPRGPVRLSTRSRSGALQNPETRPRDRGGTTAFLFVVAARINHNPGATALDLHPRSTLFLNRHIYRDRAPAPRLRGVATAIERLRKHPELLESGPDRLLPPPPGPRGRLLLSDHHDGLQDRASRSWRTSHSGASDRDGLLERIFAARKEVAALRRSLGPLREVLSNPGERRALRGRQLPSLLPGRSRSRAPASRRARDEPGRAGRTAGGLPARGSRTA